MQFRSFTRQVLLACCLTSLLGCIEYRFDHIGGERDRYIGWVTTRKELDPKIGPKSKLYLVPKGDTNPYIGGRFSRRRLTMNVGVIHYLNPRASLEIGFRRLMWETDDERFGDRTGTLTWRDNNDKMMFYIGGRINF